MSRIFTVNGKTYKAKPIDFNTICDLEDMGVSLENAMNKPLSMARAYFAICTENSKEYAGKEMQEHIVKGGSFDAVIEAMSEEMANSDFFQSLNKREEAEITEDTKAKTTKAKKSE